jgi:hypothetical protein
MKYKEFKSTAEFDALRDTYCTHCLVPFNDSDELGTCEQTAHVTHAGCTKHDP